MSQLQDLPPDLRAVLSLLLLQRKDYGALAATLGIQERAVHDRAHAGLALLAPRLARELSTAQREQVGEYLLGQADPVQSAATRAYLEGSAPARTWAQALAAELAPLAAAPLPEIPAAPTAPPAAARPTTPAAAHPATTSRTASAPAAGERAAASASESRAATAPASQLPGATTADDGSSTAPASAAPPSSRRGGAIVLGGLAAIVIVAVALIVGLGHSSGTGSNTNGSNAAGSSTTTGSSTTSGSGTTGTTSKTGTTKAAAGKPHIDSTIPLSPPNASSKAVGIVEVASQGSMYAFLVAAEHLPPTNGFRYAAWLYNSPSEAFLLGRGPTVGSNGILKAAGGLPSNASHYSKIILTEERSEKPTKPGTIVLSGPFSIG